MFQSIPSASFKLFSPDAADGRPKLLTGEIVMAGFVQNLEGIAIKSGAQRRAP
jgi:hypothetical protein